MFEQARSCVWWIFNFYILIISTIKYVFDSELISILDGLSAWSLMSKTHVLARTVTEP